MPPYRPWRCDRRHQGLSSSILLSYCLIRSEDDSGLETLGDDRLRKVETRKWPIVSGWWEFLPLSVLTLRTRAWNLLKMPVLPISIPLCSSQYGWSYYFRTSINNTITDIHCHWHDKPLPWQLGILEWVSSTALEGSMTQLLASPKATDNTRKKPEVLPITILATTMGRHNDSI